MRFTDFRSQISKTPLPACTGSCLKSSVFCQSRSECPFVGLPRLSVLRGQVPLCGQLCAHHGVPRGGVACGRVHMCGTGMCVRARGVNLGTDCECAVCACVCVELTLFFGSMQTGSVFLRLTPSQNSPTPDGPVERGWKCSLRGLSGSVQLTGEL